VIAAEGETNCWLYCAMHCKENLYNALHSTANSSSRLQLQSPLTVNADDG